MKSNDGTDVPSNCKIILDQNIPIEELLGSVTTYNNVEGSDSRSLQLRTSARVFKKMKLDSATALVISPDKKEACKGETKPEVKRAFRPLWSQEDKTLFFEALNEYGKDFEAIHSHISGKLKKKGLTDSMIKTKDQVRHLYYRTWHKISKHLRFSDDVKKIAQELYALINYGELRKKLSFISEKTCVKLNELMYRGSVSIRVKGKTVRIKTPMCRALRKLNQLDEKHDDLKLPTRVIVELRPKDMNTWMHVQNMSQNPRVRATLPLQKRLSSLISCMEDRWKARSTIEYNKALNFAKSLTEDGAILKEVLEENKDMLNPPLRLRPPKTCNLEIPTVNLSEYLTSQSVCLNAYEERIGAQVSGQQLWLNSYPNSSSRGTSRKSGIKRIRNESTSEKLSPTHLNKLLSVTDSNENCLNESDLPPTVDHVVHDAINTILALQSQDGNSSSDEKPGELCDVKMEIDGDKCDIKKEQDISKLENGWTVHDCGTLCIGDVYLMCGADSKLVLEYGWDDTETTKLKAEDVSLNFGNQTKDDEICDDTRTELEVSENNVTLNVGRTPESVCENNDNLSVTLKRLLSVAKLHYRRNRIRCPCGHECGSSSRANHARNTGMAKNLKMCSNKFCDIQEKSVLLGQHSEARSSNFRPFILEPHIRKLSPSVLFRRPSSPNDILRAQLDSIQRLKPRYCNRKGRRPRAKQLVVERKLPILANKAENGRQIVQMNIISHENVPATPIPIAPKVTASSSADVNMDVDSETVGEVHKCDSVILYMEEAKGAIAETADDSAEPLEEKVASSDVTKTVGISDNATTPSRIGSPTSVSNLIELALPPHDKSNTVLMDAPGAAKDDGTITSFVGILSQNMSSSPTPPSSPSRILKENESQWLTSDVTDFSLSSFLGHLDSPLKHAQSESNLVGEDTRLCLTQDVDAHLQSLLTENSLDYTAKFADLAAQVSDIKK